ncbi:MAG: helix-turn-helix transcriptional regulator [Candidatus Bipolaricaulota bacterium]
MTYVKYGQIMPRKYYRIISKGSAVRRARLIAGMTSAECAAAVGVSRPMLSSIENGAGTSVTTAHRIANVVGSSFEDLFEIVDATPRHRTADRPSKA